MLRVRRDEMQPLLDAWGLDAIARQIDRDLEPRSRAAAGRNGRLRRAPREEPPHRPQRRRHAARQRSGEGKRGGRHRRALRPRRPRRAAVGRRRSAPARSTTAPTTTRPARRRSSRWRRAARAQRARFPRTLVFVAFAGEERGLLGSAHYATEPAVPIENTIAHAEPRHGRPRATAASTSAASKLSPSMEADLSAAATAGGDRAEDSTRGPGRRPQRRFVVHRQADSGDQLLHRLPRRLPPPGRRLGKDRRPRRPPRRNAGARARRAARRAQRPPRVRPAEALDGSTVERRTSNARRCLLMQLQA